MKLREDVSAEVRGNLRHRAWRAMALRCGGCCGVYVLTFVVAAFLLAVFIAKTGFVAVPFVSDRVTRATEPTRVVRPALNADLDRLLRDGLRRSAGASNVEIALVESALTTFVRSALASSALTRFASTVQVVVEHEQIELFGYTSGFAGTTTSLRARGMVAPRDGQLAVEIREAMIGGIRVPRAFFGVLASRLTRKIPTFTVPVGRVSRTFTIAAIRAETGALVLTVQAVP